MLSGALSLPTETTLPCRLSCYKATRQPRSVPADRVKNAPLAQLRQLNDFLRGTAGSLWDKKAFPGRPRSPTGICSEQRATPNTASSNDHLILRIYLGKVKGHSSSEIHLHPESRHWFAHVAHAGNPYAAELGYYSVVVKWMRVAVSSSTVTPPDAVASENDAKFATIPFDFPFARLMQIIEEAVRDNQPLALAIEELRRQGHPDLPRFSSSGVSALAPESSVPTGLVRLWSPEQERALAKIIRLDETRRVWMGSLEIIELFRRRLAHEISSPTSAFGSGASASTAHGFRFNINAELILYGATEPGAKVTLGGHNIHLRADGTFSFRCAVPDGTYDLAAVAVSAQGEDSRTVELKFSRATPYLGQVGTMTQDSARPRPCQTNSTARGVETIVRRNMRWPPVNFSLEPCNRMGLEFPNPTTAKIGVPITLGPKYQPAPPKTSHAHQCNCIGLAPNSAPWIVMLATHLLVISDLFLFNSISRSGRRQPVYL